MTRRWPVSSTGSSATIDISFSPSRLLAGGLFVIHALAILAIVTLDLPLPIIVTLLLAVTLSVLYSYDRYVRFNSSRFVRHLAVSGDGRWSLTVGDRLQSVSLRSAFIHPLIVVLWFSATDRFGGYPVIVLPDNAGPDQPRRLRVRLRTGCH